MIQRNLILALRNFYRQRLFTLISLGGMSIGLTAFLLIAIYVRYELSFDKHISDHNRVYRLNQSMEFNGKRESYAKTAGPVCQFLEDNYSQIENATRVVPGNKLLVKANDKSFFERKLLFVDPSFLEMFNYKMHGGNETKLLSDPNSILLTENLAAKYFENIDPVGQSVRIGNTELIVKGVLGDIPQSTHLHFDALISMESVNQIIIKGFLENSMNTIAYTYLKTHENVSSDELAAMLNDARSKYPGGFEGIMSK